jgi:hypothetical protein
MIVVYSSMPFNLSGRGLVEGGLLHWQPGPNRQEPSAGWFHRISPAGIPTSTDSIDAVFGTLEWSSAEALTPAMSPIVENGLK